jgi:hypothetical protein
LRRPMTLSLPLRGGESVMSPAQLLDEQQLAS